MGYQARINAFAMTNTDFRQIQHFSTSNELQS